MIPGKVIWRARRGILELDSLLRGFIDTQYTSLSKAEQQQLAELLESTDTDLYDWLVNENRSNMPINYQEIVDNIQQFSSHK